MGRGKYNNRYEHLAPSLLSRIEGLSNSFVPLSPLRKWLYDVSAKDMISDC